MRTEVVKVTPELAQKWLDTMDSNRVLYENSVEEFVREIREDRWQLTHQGIGFNKDKKLVDGQHRLTAIVRTGVTVEMMVTWGLSDRAKDVVDGGTKRKLPDRLYAYTNDRIVKKIIQENGHRAKQLSAIAAFLYNVFVGKKNPNVEVAVKIIHRYNDSILTVMDTCATNRLCRRAAIMTAFVFLLEKAVTENEKATKKAFSFIEQVISGELLESGDPAYALREYLTGIGTGKVLAGRIRHSVGRMDSQWIIFIKALRACQAHLQGEKLHKLIASDSRELIEWFLDEETKVIVKKLKIGGVTNGASED